MTIYKRISSVSTAIDSAFSIPLQEMCGLSLILALMLLTFSGCSKRYDNLSAYLPFNMGEGSFKTGYLADQIDKDFRSIHPGPMAVTTFVNVDDLYSTTTFGRILSEQLMSELAMKGFEVIELRHPDALQLMDAGGEFALSRDVSVLRRKQELGAIVVGTYAVSPTRVYLNVRLIDPGSSMVLSAASAEMSKTDEIAKLLQAGSKTTNSQTNSTSGAMERIPVKRFEPSTYPASMSSSAESAANLPDEVPAPPPVVTPAPSTSSQPKTTMVKPVTSPKFSK